MTAIPEKLTFADALQRQQNLKNNSDLENLANAIERLSLERREATKRFNKHIEEIKKLEDEIVALASEIEDGAVDVGDVKELYNRAAKLSGVYL